MSESARRTTEAGPDGPASAAEDDASRDVATGQVYPDHVTDSTLGCWCFPRRDIIDPEVIIHRQANR